MRNAKRMHTPMLDFRGTRNAGVAMAPLEISTRLMKLNAPWHALETLLLCVVDCLGSASILLKVGNL